MERKCGVIAVLTLTIILSFSLSSVIINLTHQTLIRKYSSQSPLRTTTRRYSYNSTDRLEYYYEPCDFNCSWETYVSNSEFQAKVAFRDPFSIEDDQKVTALRKQLACVPFSFGYSQEKGSKVFPPYTYPPCSSFPSEPRPTLYLTNTSFSMSCPDDLPGRFLLHPQRFAPTDHLFYNDLLGYWSPQQYQRHEVRLYWSEYALGACNGPFSQAVLVPSFKQEAYQRARNTMESKLKGKKARPVTVLFVAVDSFSRRHFYRKLNETVEVLNEFNRGKEWAVFDFKLHNIIGQSSPQNMIPMFTNESMRSHRSPPRSDLLGGRSLWAIAKQWGFVTLVGFEYCGSNFINFMGKQLDVDHHVSTFYCGTRAYMGVEMGKDSKMQRCIGPHMSHYYLLNYTHAFSSMYTGVNQFIYVHVEAAHENTGQHAQTLDTDLALFLKRYTEDFGKDSDIAIIIQGDHGMQYGDWHKDIEADQEYKLPAMFLIAQTKFLERIPSSFDALWHNTFRLVSKRDFRATVLSLFGEPYGGTYPVHEEQYLQDAFILTREKVTDSRECVHTHIEPWYCSCLDTTEEIQPDFYHTFGLSPLETLLTQIITETLLIINEEVFTPAVLSANLICQKLTFDTVTHAYGYRIGKKTEQIQVEFTINELQSARIEAIAIVGVNSNHELFERRSDRESIEPFTYIGFPTHIRVPAT